MVKKSSFWVITSNHLIEGDAIWLDVSGRWTRQSSEAVVFADKSTAQQALSSADKERHLHVGAYLAAAELNDDQVHKPAHIREKIRTLGPSNYFHGKQTEL